MFCVAAAAAASTLLVLVGFEANTVIAARIEGQGYQLGQILRVIVAF